MIKSNPHACGVDDIAAYSQTRHAFGVNDGRISLLFQLPSSEWVTLPDRCRVSLAKPRSGGTCRKGFGVRFPIALSGFYLNRL